MIITKTFATSFPINLLVLTVASMFPVTKPNDDSTITAVSDRLPSPLSKKAAAAFTTAIVTGRSKEKVYNFVGLDDVFYAGSHGLEIQGPLERPVKCQVGRRPSRLREQADVYPPMVFVWLACVPPLLLVHPTAEWDDLVPGGISSHNSEARFGENLRVLVFRWGAVHHSPRYQRVTEQAEELSAKGEILRAHFSLLHGFSFWTTSTRKNCGWVGHGGMGHTCTRTWLL